MIFKIRPFSKVFDLSPFCRLSCHIHSIKCTSHKVHFENDVLQLICSIKLLVFLWKRIDNDFLKNVFFISILFKITIFFHSFFTSYSSDCLGLKGKIFLASPVTKYTLFSHILGFITYLNDYFRISNFSLEHLNSF